MEDVNVEAVCLNFHNYRIIHKPLLNGLNFSLKLNQQLNFNNFNLPSTVIKAIFNFISFLIPFLIIISIFKLNFFFGKKKLPIRDSNPGRPGESRIS